MNTLYSLNAVNLTCPIYSATQRDKFLYLANSSILANKSNSFLLYCLYQSQSSLSCVLHNPLYKKYSLSVINNRTCTDSWIDPKNYSLNEEERHFLLSTRRAVVQVEEVFGSTQVRLSAF